jgi:hypothetical protein
MANPFARAKPSGWAFGEILTSGQMNIIDANQGAASATTNCDEEQDRAGAQIPYAAGYPEGADLTGWKISSNWLSQNAVAITGRWIIDLSRVLPHGVTIIEVQALAHGNAFGGASHGGSMPTGAGRPNLLFLEQNTSGTTTYTVNQNDTAVDGGAGAYEDNHAVTLTVNRTIDRLMHYFVTVKGESGGNALDNHFAIKSMSVSWTAP